MWRDELKRNRVKNGIRGRSEARRKGGGRCGVEALESRTLMTVVINPVFGALPQTQDGGSVMKRPPINVLFWGSSWQGTNGSDPSTWDSAKSPQAEKLLVGLEQLLGSSYLNETVQYGADPSNMFLNDTAWLPSNPGSVVTMAQVDDAVHAEIGKVFPSPGNQTDGQGHQVAPIYLVITPPGTATTDPHDAAFNFNGDDNAAEIWMGTGGTNGDNSNINIDRYTRLLGHEVAELMTDPDNAGFEVGSPAAWTKVGGGGDGQIGDKEGNDYHFRMSDSAGNPSIQVQPLWSRDDQAWVVTDGTAQRFSLVPMDWNTMGASPVFGGHFSLIINGDQWLDINDQVTLSSTPGGGIKVNLNNEVVNFDPGVLTNITLQMGAGLNTVSFANELPTGVSVNMSAGSGSIVLKAPVDSGNTFSFTDTGIGNLISGGPQGYTTTNFSNVSSVVGGPKNDVFIFDEFGSLSGSVDGGAGGVNVLDFSRSVDAVQPTPVDVNLVSHTATLIGGTFSNISVIDGSSGNNTLTGAGAWSISGANAGSVGGVQFNSFQNLAGAGGNDTFSFLPGGSIGGNVNGAAGTDTLDYSALAGPVTVNFDTGTATSVGSFSNMENVIASQSGNDTIVGDAWTITGMNSGTVNGVAFSGVPNLIGGSADDSFTFMPGGTITGSIDGGTGSNTVSYANLTGATTVKLASRTGPGIGGTFANIGRFVGNGSAVVEGGNVATNWTVTGSNAFTAGSVSFSGFSSITGGSANDVFAMNTGAKLTGKIDGGAGVNSLSYAKFTGNVMVNLSLNLATNLGGESRIQNVTGGIGNSLLVGDASANVLTGGPNPTLLGLGSLSRSILIGEAGADTLNAAGSQDILIGGSTTWDKNLTALAGIFAEWSRTDLSFSQRVADLMSAKLGNPGLNGPYYLNSQTVTSDGDADTLNASVGQDWIFMKVGEDRLIGGTAAGDVTTTL